MIADEEWMRRLAAGEAHALDALLARYQQPLARFLYRRTGGRDVDDLYQETWLRVVRFSGRFRDDMRFSTWLFQIAVNVCRDWWRSRARSPDGNAVTSVEANPVAAMDASMDVQSLLDQLPDPQREVVVLRYLRDMSEREAAEVLGCPPGTVKSRLHNALSALSKLVGGRDG